MKLHLEKRLQLKYFSAFFVNRNFRICDTAPKVRINNAQLRTANFYTINLSLNK